MHNVPDGISRHASQIVGQFELMGTAVRQCAQDMHALVVRQRLADLDDYREHLPYDHPYRHMLDENTDRVFAQIAYEHPETCTKNPEKGNQS